MKKRFLSWGVRLAFVGASFPVLSAPVVKMDSANIVGVTRTVNEAKMLPLGVIYAGYGKTDGPIRVVDLISPTTLADTDRVWVYDSVNQVYVSFKFENGQWKGILNASGSKPDPEMTIDMGRGVWLSQTNPSADRPIFVHGQVPTQPVSITLAGATMDEVGRTFATSTLISRPFPTTGDWDLNADTCVNWSTVALKGDEIQTFKANGELDKTYRWNENTKKWRYRSGGGWKETCTVSRGMACWYVRNAANTVSATLTFTPPALGVAN